MEDRTWKLLEEAYILLCQEEDLVKVASWMKEYKKLLSEKQFTGTT